METAQAPPTSTDLGKIDTYTGQSSVIGVIRANLINEKMQLAMTFGVWYDLPKSRQPPPLNENTFHRGDWILGECHELSQEIRPKVPIVAILPDSLSRTMLIRTTSVNSLVIANLAGLNIVGDSFPLSSLDIWIHKAHPRLPESELKKEEYNLLKIESYQPGRLELMTLLGVNLEGIGVINPSRMKNPKLEI